MWQKFTLSHSFLHHFTEAAKTHDKKDSKCLNLSCSCIFDQLLCMSLPSESSPWKLNSCLYFTSEWPPKRSKTKGKSPQPPNKWGLRTHQITYVFIKSINITGNHGKHDHHWSPPLKRNAHKLAGVWRRGMKTVRKDSWCQKETRRSRIYHTWGTCACRCWPRKTHSTPWLALLSWAQGLQLSTTPGTLQGLLGHVFSRTTGQDHRFCPTEVWFLEK